MAKSGRPSETIVEVAKKLNVDAIVMSTHGRSGLSLLLLGSVTHKVLNTSACPVFVIPAKKEEK
ncbi:MAG: universal stress protein [Anaerolineae bacterium]|nr:universal stress protein [Anaerolineae bacterium]